MSSSTDPIYLSVERAMEFIGDANGVLTLLKTLQQTLSTDFASEQLSDDIHFEIPLVAVFPASEF